MNWVIGDIHALPRPLEALLRRVGDLDPRPVYWFVGDYVDRGPDARAVVERLLRLRDEAPARFARGNHDDALWTLLNAEGTRGGYARHVDYPSPESLFRVMTAAGMEETLVSYGVDRLAVRQTRERATREAIGGLLADFPVDHRDFFATLEPVLEHDDFFVTHAWWSPDRADVFDALGDPQGAETDKTGIVRQELLWGRFAASELHRPTRWRRRGYFGHTPTHVYDAGTRRPIVADRIVLLDTGSATYHDGRITAWCHETTDYLQAARDGSVRLVGSNGPETSSARASDAASATAPATPLMPIAATR